jgi:hypothetical protein
MIEARHLPPPDHHPAWFPLGDGPGDGLALSLSSATLIGLSLGPALVDRLTELGTALRPLAGLALHELIVNAVIHGNLQVESGRSGRWADLADRQAAVAASLADPSRAARMVTVAVRWRATEAVAVVADEGDGYDSTAAPPANRGSGRGLRFARMVGRVDVRRGGRQTAITFERFAPLEGGRP